MEIEKKPKKKKKKEEEPLKRDIFGYCSGCTPDICSSPCSTANNFNLPF